MPHLPEAVIAGREDVWLRWFFSEWCYNPECITGDDFETYVRAYQSPGAVRGAMDDYRAGTEDVAQDKADQDIKIAAPTLALWGEQSPVIVGLFDIKSIWQDMAKHVQFATIPHCGHLPPEEQPELVSQALLAFLGANG